MNIIKSLHPGLLHRCFSYREKHYFTVSVLWGFNLLTGEPVLEQELWGNIGDMLGKNELFDVGFPKKNAEVLVHGSCFAPNDEAVNASRVGVSLGSISKELLVFGDRHWIKGMGIGWGVSDPKPFVEMPVSYANAFGGKAHAPNPVGIGIDEVDLNGGLIVPLPNIEYANQLIGSLKDKPQPASLNRTDIMCEQRLANSGTYDQKYIETRMPGFPDDLNYDYFNDAANDQWVEGYFNGDEQYEIRNMHSRHSLIKGQIPNVYGRVFVNHQVNDVVEFKEISTQLDTIWFFPAAELGIMVHRGTVEVGEDDASDIKQLLIANENKNDTPRDPSHYENELALRTDPQEAFMYLLYTAPLIPEGCRCGFETLQENADFPLEMLALDNIENFADAKKQEMEASFNEQIETARKQMVESGMAPQQVDALIKQLTDAKDKPAQLTPEMQQIAEVMEKIIPGAQQDPKNIDFSKINLKAIDELNFLTEKMQAEKKNEAKKKLVEQLDEMRRNLDNPEASQSIAQLENVLLEMELPPLLPRIDGDGVVDQIRGQADEMEKQLVIMQSMGLPEAELAKIKSSFNVEEIERQVREGLEKANDGYRVGAHYIPTGRSPHAGREGDIREQLIKAYQSRGNTSHGDYAFVDLSGLDLSGIDLSHSYLEYADLTNTNLTNANLSKAILSHAIVSHTNFTNANLIEANLGAIDFDGTEFVNADLTGATLSKSNIRKTIFKQCKMAEKMDMFLETRFDDASFIECDLRKNAFIDADISGCDFTDSNLSESSFVNPIMKQAIFTRANLSGTNFVTAKADDSKFDNANMKNVRFVAESSLENCDFRGADASEANLRDCNLQQAKFGEASLLKTDFGGANLKHADFEKANAVGAQFNKTDLTFATLHRTDLMEGSMYKAILSATQFTQANLYGVNFLGCTIGETDFTGANVEQTVFKDWKP
jgi:uncharacterized protein YjbI with pentapeptide repeats